MAKLVPENIQTLLGMFKFDIDDECINEDLTCTICKHLLYDAYQSSCGCKYCRKCIVSYINDGNEYCPGGKEECREDILMLDESVLSNAFLNKKVLKVRVRCPNESCQFASTLTKIEDHLRVCSLHPMECPYKVIGCSNVRVNRDSVETHFNKDMLAHSQMLMEVVDNLKNDVSGLKEELRANKLEMSSLQEKCKFKEREIREEERKIAQEERETLAVGLEELKLEVAALRGQVEWTVEKQLRLEKLEEVVMELRGKIEIVKEESKKMIGEIGALKKEVEIERGESKMMSGEIDTLKKELRIKREELKEMRGEIEVLQGDVKRIDDVTGRKKKTEEEAAGIIDRRVGELTKTVDSISKSINKEDAVWSLWINKWNDVRSLWFKVDGFAELMKKGESTFSPHLYSHINGYKLRIRVNVYLGGSLYVYSVICKGEYDDVLSWPAWSLSVSVTVINHRTKEAYKTGTIKYDDQYQMYKYYSKPIDKDNEPYRILWLSPSNPASTPGMIVSDCLILLVTARPP